MKQKVALNKRSLIIDEVRLQFNRAQKRGWNKLAAELASCLQDYYYLEVSDKRIGRKYEALALHYIEISRAETITMSKYSRLFYELIKTRSPGEKVTRELRMTCTELKPYLKYHSEDIWVFTHSLCNILAYIEQDYERIVEQCRTVIDYFEKHNINRTPPFHKDMAATLIRLGRYEEAEQAIGNAVRIVSKGGTVWSTFLYYQVVLDLHRGRYQDAYDKYCEAIKRKRIISAMTETWVIVKAYFNFLSTVGLLLDAREFRVGKFLNNITVFVSDKSGANSNVVILKIILRLNSERGRAAVIDQQEKIEKYAHRYLKKGSRTKLFFQMLLQIVPGDFEREKVERKAARYLNRMPAQKGYDADMEMIPYEVLWGLVLRGLD